MQKKEIHRKILYLLSIIVVMYMGVKAIYELEFLGFWLLFSLSTIIGSMLGGILYFLYKIIDESLKERQ